MVEGDTYIHHVRLNAHRYNNHLFVLPLCYDDHQGRHGVHGDQRRLLEIEKSEIELLEVVEGLL